MKKIKDLEPTPSLQSLIGDGQSLPVALTQKILALEERIKFLEKANDSNTENLNKNPATDLWKQRGEKRKREDEPSPDRGYHSA